MWKCTESIEQDQIAQKSWEHALKYMKLNMLKRQHHKLMEEKLLLEKYRKYYVHTEICKPNKF